MELMDIVALESILPELRRPFPPDMVSWKPGALNKAAKDWKRPAEPPKDANGKLAAKAAAMAYGDFRAYMRRLEEVTGGHWEVRYTPWGNDRLIAELTIYGVTRCGTGEYNEGGGKNAPEGTAAEAQAFKRAAAQFGLGRYLYDLPTKWVIFDVLREQISDEGKAELDAWYESFYKRAEAQIAAKQKAAPVRPPLPPAPAAPAKPVSAPIPAAKVEPKVEVKTEATDAQAVAAEAQALVDAVGLTKQVVVTPVAPAEVPATATDGAAEPATEQVWSEWKGISDAKKWAAQHLQEAEYAPLWVATFQQFGRMNKSNEAQVFAAFVDAVLAAKASK